MMRILLSLLLILSMQQAGYAALGAHWTLQDNAASTTITATVGTNASLSGAGNTSASTVTPGPGTTYTRAISLDGVNDYIFAFNGTSTFTKNKAFLTMACWFKVPAADTTTNHYLMFASNNAGITRATIVINTSGQILAGARAGDGESQQTKTSTNSYDDDTWHHVAAVIDYANDAITIYVDGTSVAQSGTISFTATASSNTDSTVVNLGSQNAAGYYKGQLADCRFYDSDESANIGTIRSAAGLASTIDPLSTSIPGSSADPLTGTIPGL